MSERDAPKKELPFDPPLSSTLLSAAPRSATGTLPGFAIDLVQMESEAGASTLSARAVDGVAITTVNPGSGKAHLMYVSENLASMLGYRPDQLLGQSPNTLFADNTPEAQLDAVAEVVEQGQQATVRLDLSHANGADIAVDATFLALPSIEPGLPYYLALYRSASRWSRPEIVLADSSDMLESLVNGQDLMGVLLQAAERVETQIHGATCWIGLADPSGRIEPALAGDQRGELVDATFEFLTESGRGNTLGTLRVDDLPLEIGMELRSYGVHALWIHPIAGPDSRGHGTLVIAHGERAEPHPVELQMVEQLTRVISVSADRALSEATLAYQTLHDPLTKLPNRTLIVDRLEQALARLGRDDNRVAVLLVDLDRFKALNDIRGSEAGDDVLIEVGRRLRRTVRLGDTVGRIGGDQFLVVCVAMNGEADASTMAQRIVRTISDPIDLRDQSQLETTASVGVVLVDQPGDSPAKIISNAESALASAVETNRGEYALFSEGLQQHVALRHETERALHVALQEDQLVLHYQPLVDIKSGRMIGAEALIRWERPGHGLLAPFAFIELAEETGLIVPIGAWVIDEACRQIANWPPHPDGSMPIVSVNLSARQLGDDSLLATVADALSRHGVDARHLGFEVTESMRVEEVEKAIITLKKLGALGSKLAIDDFGIGYATLDYLRRFSMADTIKIDRSFVSGLGQSREDTAIVSASIALANSLGLSVVAEGVETVEQYDKLAELGCEVAQGYLLSRPVPLPEVLALWERDRLIRRDKIA